MRLLIGNFLVEATEIRFAKYGNNFKEVCIEFKDGTGRNMIFTDQQDARKMLEALSESPFEIK